MPSFFESESLDTAITFTYKNLSNVEPFDLELGHLGFAFAFQASRVPMTYMTKLWGLVTCLCFPILELKSRRTGAAEAVQRIWGYQYNRHNRRRGEHLSVTMLSSAPVHTMIFTLDPLCGCVHERRRFPQQKNVRVHHTYTCARTEPKLLRE